MSDEPIDSPAKRLEHSKDAKDTKATKASKEGTKAKEGGTPPRLMLCPQSCVDLRPFDASFDAFVSFDA